MWLEGILISFKENYQRNFLLVRSFTSSIKYYIQIGYQLNALILC